MQKDEQKRIVVIIAQCEQDKIIMFNQIKKEITTKPR